MKCYLTRRSNSNGDRCLITYYKPEFANVGETGRREAWPIPGDPISFDCCWWSAVAIFGASDDQDILETIRVRIEGVKLDGKKRNRSE